MHTVKELIETLQKFPQDLPVLVRGYDEGFDDLGAPVIHTVKHTPNSRIWQGDFTESEEGFDVLTLEAQN